jgi:hypothetical protein
VSCQLDNPEKTYSLLSQVRVWGSELRTEFEILIEESSEHRLYIVVSKITYRVNTET